MLMRVILYLMFIVLANVITARFQPVQIGMFHIPWGTFLIGATFIFRDLVQNKYGKGKTYLFILIALILSAVSSYLLGDTLWIVMASALSFLIAESTDTEIYSRLKLAMSWRVLYSGLVGGLFDSVVFIIIGLSPLGAGFIPWEAVPAAIIGQVIVKTIMQGCGAILLSLMVKNSRFRALILSHS